MTAEAPGAGAWAVRAASLYDAARAAQKIEQLITLNPNGRYDFVNENFGGSANTTRMYGADGKNPAFGPSPPQPMPAFRNLPLILLSRPTPRITSVTSAPTRSQIFAISLAKPILVARNAFAAYLITSALRRLVNRIGTSIKDGNLTIEAAFPGAVAAEPAETPFKKQGKKEATAQEKLRDALGTVQILAARLEERDRSMVERVAQIEGRVYGRRVGDFRSSDSDQK